MSRIFTTSVASVWVHYVAKVERKGRTTDELEQVSDPEARAVGEQLVAAVIDMHGEGLERVLEADARARDRAREVVAARAEVSGR